MIHFLSTSIANFGNWLGKSKRRYYDSPKDEQLLKNHTPNLSTLYAFTDGTLNNNGMKLPGYLSMISVINQREMQQLP